ncbi:transmembrane protein (plasmid) [Legionella adelaidensis]|uniref:Transmembrane protein n=1 Tax=Legionella adelaidensis TaxID=45056 RepID=A0A0W0R192_9GAMM|nr:Mpo1-like protein [Legionella adelaidensis]KTC64865.1 transmembrane protein [Legionella adelaidensis]VEH82964.1 transmembrane protein [Legionella adelaidensis]
MMIPFILQAREYAQYHRNPYARYVHMASIILLLLAFMVFFNFIHVFMPGVFEITLTDILVLLVLIYYFRLNWLIALTVTPLFIILLWIANTIGYGGPTVFSIWTFLILLIVGILLHVIGHLMEGRYPSLRTNLWHTLLSPLFLTAEIFFLFGKMSTLREEIHGAGPVVVDVEIVDTHVEKTRGKKKGTRIDDH